MCFTSKSSSKRSKFEETNVSLLSQEIELNFSPYTPLFCATKNTRRLPGLSLLNVTRDIKLWNHLHMCAVVLWTKIVVEFL